MKVCWPAETSARQFDLDAPEDSLLLSAINHEDLEMPPNGKLSPGQIESLTKWVKQGALYPEGGLTFDAHAHAGPPQVNDENRKFWSFQPVQRPAVPEVGSSGWATNEVDRFILAKLEATRPFAEPALPPRQTLIRRATYDLTGLPPSARRKCKRSSPTSRPRLTPS